MAEVSQKMLDSNRGSFPRVQRRARSVRKGFEEGRGDIVGGGEIDREMTLNQSL